MALRRIMTVEQDTLYKVSRPVTRFDKRLHDLLDDMAQTLENVAGIGLAAPQVGILRRVFLVDTGEIQLLEMINPEILETSGEEDGMEGCLSLPDRWGMVKRPSYVRVRAQNRYGQWFEREAHGLIARCILHEYDHLDGHLYSEKVHHWLTDEEIDTILDEER